MQSLVNNLNVTYLADGMSRSESGNRQTRSKILLELGYKEGGKRNNSGVKICRLINLLIYTIVCIEFVF